MKEKSNPKGTTKSKDTLRSEKLTEAGLLEILALIEHPEIKNRNLGELGMIPRVKIEKDRINVELSLPFLEASVKDDLIAKIQQALHELAPDAEIDVETTQMDPRRRAAFMAMARGEGDPTRSLQGIARTIAVMSGKGGVGKSSVAGLLASTLKRQGLRVGVLDADITGPSIPKVFGVHQSPEAGPAGLKPVLSSSGIEIMSINLLLPDKDQPVVWRGPLIAKAIEQFWRDIAWSDLDYLIIDLPPGTSDAALTVMQSLPLDGIVLVTSPQDLAGMVVRKAANMAKRLGIRLLGIVENMSYVVCPECGADIEVFGPSRSETTAQVVGTDLLGRIPLAPEFSILCDQGKIESFQSASFDVCAEKILAHMPSEEQASPKNSSAQEGRSE